MLSISPQAAAALQEYSRPAFVTWLQGHLSEAYPHLLPRFPPDVQYAIVVNMLDRASARGLSQQNTLVIWCELMIEIAPNFDHEPEIDAALKRASHSADAALLEFTSLVSSHAWERAEQRSSNLPLFVPFDLSAASILDQTAGAIPTVLYDRPEATSPHEAAARASKAAEGLGISAFPDSALVIAACRSFWGADFASLEWTADLLREGWHGSTLIDALRLRLALEFGRVV